MSALKRFADSSQTSRQVREVALPDVVLKSESVPDTALGFRILQ